MLMSDIRVPSYKITMPSPPDKLHACLTVSCPAVDTRVVVDNVKVDTWTFGPNNVLTYQTDAGHSAWLQFVHLAQGPIILGKFRETESEVLESERHLPSLPPSSLLIPSVCFHQCLFQLHFDKAIPCCFRLWALCCTRKDFCLSLLYQEHV